MAETSAIAREALTGVQQLLGVLRAPTPTPNACPSQARTGWRGWSPPCRAPG